MVRTSDFMDLGARQDVFQLPDIVDDTWELIGAVHQLCRNAEGAKLILCDG